MNVHPKGIVLLVRRHQGLVDGIRGLLSSVIAARADDCVARIHIPTDLLPGIESTLHRQDSETSSSANAGEAMVIE